MAAASSGLVPRGSTPILAMAAFISGCCSTLLISPLSFASTAGRNAGGREDPEPEIDVEAGKPGLRDRRHVGIDLAAHSPGGGEWLHAIVGGERYRSCDAGERQLHLAAQDIRIGGADAAIGHVCHVDAGLLLDHLAGQMRRRPDAGGRKVELAGIGLGVGDELGKRFHRQMQRRNDHRRRGADDGHRLQPLGQIIRHVLQQRRVGHHAGIGQHDRVAVRGRACGHVDAHDAAGARTVLGYHRHSHRLAEPHRQIAPGSVDDAAGDVRENEPDRLARISLRLGGKRCRREHCRADQTPTPPVLRDSSFCLRAMEHRTVAEEAPAGCAATSCSPHLFQLDPQPAHQLLGGGDFGGELRRQLLRGSGDDLVAGAVRLRRAPRAS